MVNLHLTCHPSFCWTNIENKEITTPTTVVPYVPPQLKRTKSFLKPQRNARTRWGSFSNDLRVLPSAKALRHQQIKALAKSSPLARVPHGTSSTGALGSQYCLLATIPPSFSHDHPAGGDQGSAALAGMHFCLGADSVIGVQSMTLIFPWGFPQ